MRLRGLGRLRHIAAKTKNRISPSVRILLYHRVARIPSDPQWLNVPPTLFEEQMSIVREKFIPISLQEATDRIAKKDLPRNAIAVTFDDGYADNLHEAKPILEKYKIPATVFVATGYIGGKQEFWWDEMESLIFTPKSVPERFAIEIRKKKYNWQLAETKTPSPAPHNWNVFSKETPTKRHQLYRELTPLVKESSLSEREFILDSLAYWAGHDRNPRPTHLPMTVDEVRELGKDGLVEIGAHTVNHPMLSTLSPEQQAQEIRESKQTLEKILKRPISSFAYPFGGGIDYTEKTVAALQREGFGCACSAIPNCARENSDLFQLPRFFVRDWNGQEFRNQLSRFAAE